MQTLQHYEYHSNTKIWSQVWPWKLQFKQTYFALRLCMYDLAKLNMPVFSSNTWNRAHLVTENRCQTFPSIWREKASLSILNWNEQFTFVTCSCTLTVDWITQTYLFSRVLCFNRPLTEEIFHKKRPRPLNKIYVKIYELHCFIIIINCAVKYVNGK